MDKKDLPGLTFNADETLILGALSAIGTSLVRGDLPKALRMAIIYRSTLGSEEVATVNKLREKIEEFSKSYAEARGLSQAVIDNVRKVVDSEPQKKDPKILPFRKPEGKKARPSGEVRFSLQDLLGDARIIDEAPDDTRGTEPTPPTPA